MDTDCLVERQTPKAGSRIPWGWIRGDRPDFHESETERRHHADGFTAFVITGGKSDRVGESDPRHTAFQSLVREVIPARCRCPQRRDASHEFAHTDRAVVNRLGIEAEQERANQRSIHAFPLPRFRKSRREASLLLGDILLMDHSLEKNTSFKNRTSLAGYRRSAARSKIAVRLSRAVGCEDVSRSAGCCRVVANFASNGLKQIKLNEAAMIVPVLGIYSGVPVPPRYVNRLVPRAKDRYLFTSAA